MTISAKIIADSISSDGVRLTTYQLRYPRFIHAEVMTHRKFSRNASSSRAIPVSKLLSNILEDIACPVHWGANQSGMQAKAELPKWKKVSAQILWKSAAYAACGFAWVMNELGAHKQLVNRITEPFAHIDVIVTATDFNNFFALRYHEDAQPEIYALAEAMYDAFIASTPKLLNYGEWHLPYITDEERLIHPLDDLIKMSVARCARVSYLNHDQSAPDIQKDIKLYARLLERAPLHASPAEHQGTPDRWIKINNLNNADGIWEHPEKHGNLEGYIQFRKTLPNEYIPEFSK